MFFIIDVPCCSIVQVCNLDIDQDIVHIQEKLDKFHNVYRKNLIFHLICSSTILQFIVKIPNWSL